jgi:general secretion pathway protein G
MKLPLRAARRPGFTLVEMLVVLAIIVVLVSLVAGVVLRFLGQGPIMQAQTEISQLNQSVELFKQKYGIYPPSKIFLANTQADYVTAKTNDPTNAAFYDQSWSIINRIFPKLDWNNTSGQGLIDWTGNNGAGPVYKAFKGTFLEGDQCLVFFLGGMQTSAGGVNSCLGFANNSRNPTSMINTANNYPPLFEFSSRRLGTVTRVYTKTGLYGQSPSTFSFFVYADTYDTGVPYAYFSTYGNRNGYQTNDCASQVSASLSTPTQTIYLTPYLEANATPVRYYNPNTFQIISAGADGDFGDGGFWNPGLNPVNRPTTDNQSNFNTGGLMGTRS